MKNENEIKKMIAEVKHEKARIRLNDVFECIKDGDKLMTPIFIGVLKMEVKDIQDTKELEYINKVFHAIVSLA